MNPTAPTPTPSLISQLEDICNIKGKLTALGYSSVFEVVRIPRERFIRQHRNGLGQPVGKVYDLAVGYAHQVAHSFRRTRANRADKQALGGPFSRSGPDYPSQFNDNWKAMSPHGALESDDSPVAYLTAIYNEALSQEKTGDSTMITLEARRPDIKDLLLDDAAVNQAVSQLQLVNKILSSAIQRQMNKSSATDVNIQLATTRYPNNLPYHFAYQQVVLASEQSKTPLFELLSQQVIDAPLLMLDPTQKLAQAHAAQLNCVLSLGSGLAPEQIKIIREPPAFSAETSTVTKAAWYQANYGKNISAITTSGHEELQPLLDQTGLNVPQVEQLICCRAGMGSEEGDYLITISKNIESQSLSKNIESQPLSEHIESQPLSEHIESQPLSKHIESQSLCTNKEYGAIFLHAGAEPNTPNLKLKNDGKQILRLYGLTDDRLDRLNRIVRLQKWLDLPYDQVDLLITSAMRAEGANNPALTMNDNTLRTLGVFRHYQQAYGVSAEQFAAWLYQVTPYAITPNVPFLDRVFNSPSLFDTPFKVDATDFNYSQTTGDDGTVVKQIATALQLSASQFQQLADKICAQQQDKSNTLKKSLDVVSAFYRLATLPRALGLSIEEGMTVLDWLDNNGAVWKQLAGKPTIINPTTIHDGMVTNDALSLLQAFAWVVEWLRSHRLSVATSALIMKKNTDGANRLQGTAAQLAFIQQLNVALKPALLEDSQWAHSSAPTADLDKKPLNWSVLLKELVDKGLIRPPTISAMDDTQTALINKIEEVVRQQKLSDKDKKKAVQQLVALLDPVRQMQEGLLASALANILKVSHALPLLFVRWAGTTSYKMLAATQQLSKIKQEKEIPQQYLLDLGEIARAAVTAAQFQLSPAMLQCLLAHPKWFGVEEMGSTGSGLSLLSQYALSRYADWLHQTSEHEDAVLAYLSAVNGADAPDPRAAANQLATLLSWTADEVAAAAEPIQSAIKTATTMLQIDAVMRLQALSARSGLTVAQLLQLNTLCPDADYAVWQTAGQAMVAGVSHLSAQA